MKCVLLLNGIYMEETECLAAKGRCVRFKKCIQCVL